jgi:hypothetical protein
MLLPVATLTKVLQCAEPGVNMQSSEAAAHVFGQPFTAGGAPFRHQQHYIFCDSHLYYMYTAARSNMTCNT